MMRLVSVVVLLLYACPNQKDAPTPSGAEGRVVHHEESRHVGSRFDDVIEAISTHDTESECLSACQAPNTMCIWKWRLGEGYCVRKCKTNDDCSPDGRCHFCPDFCTLWEHSSADSQDFGVCHVLRGPLDDD